MTRDELNARLADLDPVRPMTIGSTATEVLAEIRALKETVKALGEQLEWLTACLDMRFGVTLPPRPTT